MTVTELPVYQTGRNMFGEAVIYLGTKPDIWAFVFTHAGVIQYEPYLQDKIHVSADDMEYLLTLKELLS